MSADVLRNSFAERRRGYVGWAIAIVLLGALTFAFYPSVRDNAEFDRIMEELPEALRTFVGEKDLTSPEGYLESQLFLYLVPLLFFVYTIGQGSDAIAGEERRKTLDLLLAQPIARARVVVEKFASTAVGLTGLGAVLLATLLVGAAAADMDIGAEGLAAVTLGCVLLGLQMGALALAVGAATGRKGVAVATAAAIATGAYLVHSFATQIAALEPVQRFSPFYLYIGGDPLSRGFRWVDLFVLAALTLVLLWYAVFAFTRRDVEI